MAKTKIKTAVPDLPENKRLTHPEAMALILAQHELRTSTMAKNHLNVTLRAQELEAHVALTATRQALEEAKATASQAQAKHDRISAHLAKTHDFDWATSGFDPVTGEIQPLPESGAQ